MCFAIPPNSIRAKNYALPFTFTGEGRSSAVAATAGQSFSTQASGEYAASQMAQQQQQFATPASCNYFQPSTTCSTFDTPSTPTPQASGSSSFDFGLAPTGLSPMRSAMVATAGAPTNASSAMAAAAPLVSMPTEALHSRKPTVAKRRRRGPQRPGKTATHKERLFVQHNYHDLALEPDIPRDSDRKSESGNNSNSKASSSSSTKKSSLTVHIMSECFPVKLHRILEETDAAGQSHIISWSPHGRAFKIHNPALFTAQIMPHYFPKMKKLTSLQRQFNLYGFERLTRDGPDGGAYYHEAFLRYRPGLSAQRLFRRRVKGTGYKAASNPDAEPDLYAVKSMYEVMGSLKTNEELVAAVHEQAAVQVMGSTPSFYPVLDHSPSVVTQSTRAPSFTSQSTRTSTTSESSSSEDTSHSSSMIAQDPMSNNFAMMPVLQQEHQQQVQQEDIYDRFFSSLNEPPQDSFLREFFGSNDVTPMSPGFQLQQQQISQAPPPAVVNSTARTTTTSTGIDQGILMEFADLWENATSRVS